MVLGRTGNTKGTHVVHMEVDAMITHVSGMRNRCSRPLPTPNPAVAIWRQIRSRSFYPSSGLWQLCLASHRTPLPPVLPLLLIFRKQASESLGTFFFSQLMVSAPTHFHQKLFTWTGESDGEGTFFFFLQSLSTTFGSPSQQ